jgi:hypothetical protein
MCIARRIDARFAAGFLASCLDATGRGSKDTWVLGGVDEHAPVRRVWCLQRAAQCCRANFRAASRIIFLARPIYRARRKPRSIRALLLPTLSGEEDFGRWLRWKPPPACLQAWVICRRDDFASIGEQHWQVQRALTEMIYDPSQMSSLRWNLREMRRASWHLKERLSLDTWRVLQQLEAQFSRVPPASVDHRYLAGMDLLDNVIVTLSAFSGLLTENTTRGLGWVFLEIGPPHGARSSDGGTLVFRARVGPVRP